MPCMVRWLCCRPFLHVLPYVAFLNDFFQTQPQTKSGRSSLTLNNAVASPCVRVRRVRYVRCARMRTAQGQRTPAHVREHITDLPGQRHNAITRSREIKTTTWMQGARGVAHRWRSAMRAIEGTPAWVPAAYSSAILLFRPAFLDHTLSPLTRSQIQSEKRS